MKLKKIKTRDKKQANFKGYLFQQEFLRYSNKNKFCIIENLEPILIYKLPATVESLQFHKYSKELGNLFVKNPA